MRVGDLIQDKNYADLAVIIGEKPEQFTVYYMPAKANMYASRGGAIIDGRDSAYDAARNKMRGHEPDVVAGLVVASLSILTVVYLYHSAKTARDAF